MNPSVFNNQPEGINPLPGIDRSKALPHWTFEEWEDEKVLTFMEENDMLYPRKLDDGSWVAMHRLLFAWSICCDVKPIEQYSYRWCFTDQEEALYFLNTIKEFDEVPVKRNSLKGHRYVDAPRLISYDKNGFKRW